MMEYIKPFTDIVNVVVGGVVAFLAFIFGDHWILFAFFLGLNIGDYITGWMKTKLTQTANSAKGLKGVIKKLGYWIMIALSFGMAVIFQEVGGILGLDLEVTVLLGWFVLASLIVNEIRSILENLVEAGFNVPEILIRGLEVANKIVDEVNEKIEDTDGIIEINTDDPYSDIVQNINFSIKPEDLAGKTEIRLKVRKDE